MKKCPTCQNEIPNDAPEGLCPHCLLGSVQEDPISIIPAPDIALIDKAFPQLTEFELIGQGGMGFIYKAQQPDLDRTIALKILSPELGKDPAFTERFAREARVLGKLNHPHIVTIFEHGENDGFFYLMMEYVDGVNLREAMTAQKFTPEQALAVIPDICDALQSAHDQGIWHRDIKPENILLDQEGKVKIADFGIARIIGDRGLNFTLTNTGNALGSAAYMSPEQHENPHKIDHRADIYSLGVVLYEMLTGELPLGRFPAPSERSDVDQRIDDLVLRTLEKERELRQQSAAQIKTDIAHLNRSKSTPNYQKINTSTNARIAQEIHSKNNVIAPISLCSIILFLSGVILGLASSLFTSGNTQDLLITLSVALGIVGFILIHVSLTMMRRAEITHGLRSALRYCAWYTLVLGVIFIILVVIKHTKIEKIDNEQAKQTELYTKQGSDRHDSLNNKTKSTLPTTASSELKAKKIIIPNFSTDGGFDIGEIIDFLRDRSEEHDNSTEDPKAKGVNILTEGFNPEEVNVSSMRLKQVTFYTLINHIARVCDLEVEYREELIVLIKKPKKITQ